MDALAFMIEAEALGLLAEPQPRVIPAPETVAKPEPPRRGKKAARAKRQKANT